MPEFQMPPVVAAAISPQQPLHPGHQIGLGRLDYQMKVIVHQAIRMHLPAGLFAGLRQRLKEPVPVLVIGKDGILAVSAIHHMINRARILNAQLPRHGRTH